jgi:protein involved in polysaccharide export with SLBB domain
MIKRLLLFVALSFSFMMVAAQTVSDEQVVKMIMAEKKNGSDEATIAQKLLNKGVTPAQLRRIKEKYEHQDKGLGSLGMNDGEEKVDRLRDKKKKDDAKGDNFMVSSAEEKDDKTTPKKKQEKLQNEMGFLDLDSILYYKNQLKDGPTVFGRNLFNNELLTFEPAINIPAPADYVLGAGDQVIIDIWGASQLVIDEVISPKGYLTIAGVGPIKLSGMTVTQATKRAKDVLSKYYSGSSITLSLANTRSVKVEIVGEVVTPGSYTLSAFSTLFNALYMAGGISDLGSLRDIKVYRNGKVVSSIDVYDYIMNGNNKGNIRLQDNDLIIVSPYEAIVNIQGKVKRPMMYEMKSQESLANLLKYTGGLTGDAYDRNIRVIRKSGREYSVHTVVKDSFSSFNLADGDSIYVDSIIPRFSNMVEIKGAVFHPGMYEVNENIKTVLDLIDAADGLYEDAFLARAVMHRRKANRRLEVLSIDLEGIIDGRVPDIELRKEDVLYIPSVNDMRGQETMKISGEVNYPGVYEFAENTTLEDFVLQAGGLTNVASTAKIDVYRRIYNPQSLEGGDTITEVYCFSLKEGFVIDGTPGFELAPFDEVHVRKSPINNLIKSVTVDGAVNFKGDYAMNSHNYRLSELVKDAGGFASAAYPQGARLYRKMSEEEKAQRENMIKQSQKQIYEDALRSDKTFDMAISDSLINLNATFGDAYLLDIDLKKAVDNPGCDADIALREGDKLIVPEYAATVKISGEVRFPVTVTYLDGKRLNYYIKHAGGYADRAKKNSVYAIYMNGGVKKISKLSSKDIQPGMEIVVPAKSLKKKLSTAEVVTISSSAVSIATMVVSIVNMLSK